GVYAAIAAPRFKVNCNAAVILTDDGVIVVDSHSKPSAARALYGEIQGITKKPVKKVINTHFHWDHWQGNGAYAAASPGVEIVASERTRENLTRPDAGVGGIPYIEEQIAAMPAEIDKLKDDIRKTSDPKLKANLESNLQQAESFYQELKQMKPALPTRTVSTTVTLAEQGREIRLHVLGRAHTDGDLFIYMPRERVVATGDAVIDWMPFLNDGFPEDWVHTLSNLEKLDFDQMIPGHGDVKPKAHLAFFRGYFVELIESVKKAAAEGASLDEMKKTIGDRLAPKYEAAMSRYPIGQYRDRVGLNVEMVYLKVVKKS
ncbi:MAG TPA: MBL fold metallo-hydrolase, partial [Candidatus Methylomirabilis sp.]|nr:MBL fold metallo-hydrolase [Candidatus Methylomirabilis sp.]